MTGRSLGQFTVPSRGCYHIRSLPNRVITHLKPCVRHAESLCPELQPHQLDALDCKCETVNLREKKCDGNNFIVFRQAPPPKIFPSIRLRSRKFTVLTRQFTVRRQPLAQPAPPYGTRSFSHMAPILRPAWVSFLKFSTNLLQNFHIHLFFVKTNLLYLKLTYYLIMCNICYNLITNLLS